LKPGAGEEIAIIHIEDTVDRFLLQTLSEFGQSEQTDRRAVCASGHASVLQ